MAIPALSDFRAQFPELSIAAGASDAMVNLYLAEKIAFWDSGALGTAYFQIVLLDTAHEVSQDLIARSAANGGLQVPPGPVSSVGGAGITTSFAASAVDAVKGGSRAWYQTTWYGRKLLRLRDNAVPSGYVNTSYGRSF